MTQDPGDAMERVREEQAQRAETLRLLEEWEEACAGVSYSTSGAARYPHLDVTRLTEAGDKLANALSLAVLGVKLEREKEEE